MKELLLTRKRCTRASSCTMCWPRCVLSRRLRPQSGRAVRSADRLSGGAAHAAAPGDAGRASRQLRRAGAPRAGGRGRRKSGVYAECTVIGNKTEAVPGFFIPACLKLHLVWQDFVQKSGAIIPPQRTARKRAYNRKGGLCRLFHKIPRHVRGFYRGKGFCALQSGRAESAPDMSELLLGITSLDHERGRDRS